MKIKLYLNLLARAILAGVVLLSACKSPQTSDKLEAPLFDNMGEHKVPVSTRSEMAQRFFDQGLNLAYGFNHGEAERSYREAVRQDSTFAMGYWGVAHVLGTNYNVFMDEAVRKEAERMIKKAVLYKNTASDWEQALIEAAATRYNYDKTEDQKALDQDYARAMRKVYKQFPEQYDLATLYAESLMNLHPWDLYTRRGEPKPWTPEITNLLETILEKSPKHPGANHLYVHAVEASSSPERALTSAGRLEDLVPGVGHMVHMPSHIYIRTGHYHKGSEVNIEATMVDSIYVTNCSTQGVYPLMLFPHNIHFLAATAALEGRGELSVNAAFSTATNTDTTVMRDAGWQTLQHYTMIPHYVLVKFGQWDKILSLKKPAADLIYPNAVWHYARGMAFAGKNEMDKAQRELSTIKAIAQDTAALQEITIWDLNSTDQLINIASRVLEAEILRKNGMRKSAIALLKEAVNIEDQLNYNEPPDWFFSVRHPLGAVLIEDGQFAEAEAVYEEDLFFTPENGWALNGLYQSLSKQDKEQEALAVKVRFEKAWQYADVTLSNSEVVPVAYRNIQQDSFYGSFLAGLPTITSCGIRNK